MLKKFGGDAALLREVAGVFIESCPQMMNALREAIAQQNSSALQRAAHTLKSSVDYFGDKIAFDKAFSLERRGKAADWTDVAETARELEAAIERLLPVLTALTLSVNSESAAS